MNECTNEYRFLGRRRAYIRLSQRSCLGFVIGLHWSVISNEFFPKTGDEGIAREDDVTCELRAGVGDAARSSRRARCQPAFYCADYTTTAAAVRAQAHRLPASSPDRPSIKHIDILRRHADVSERLAVQPRKLVTLMLNLQIAADASRHQPKPRHDNDKHAKSRLKFVGHRGPRFAVGGKTRESPRPAAAGLPERRSGRQKSCVSSVRCSHTYFRQGCGAA